MGIFDRMGKVIQSNLNALLDKAEDDKKLVELNLDEMDEQIKAGHKEVIRPLAADKQLTKKCDDLRADVQRWDHRAELALKSGDEALAREALKQKKRTTGRARGHRPRRAASSEAAALKMKEDLERMKQKLAELKLKRGTIVARAAAGARRPTRSSSARREGRARSTTSAAWRRRSRAARPRAPPWPRSKRPSERAEERGSRGEVPRARASGRQGRRTAPSDIDDELAALKKRIRV